MFIFFRTTCIYSSFVYIFIFNKLLKGVQGIIKYFFSLMENASSQLKYFFRRKAVLFHQTHAWVVSNCQVYGVAYHSLIYNT